MTDTATRKKKLIEVALPLEEVSRAARADKAVKTGTLRNLHKWFAPMPLPAWRALLFAALVDDPEDDNRRVYLLDLVKRLVANGAGLPDAETLAEAKSILDEQFPAGLPTVFDPFCGGGSTLVEAQRLGLPTFGSDLNPIPALITRTITQTLPAVHGQQSITESLTPFATDTLPVGDSHPTDGYEGLIKDVRYYASLIKDEAEQLLQGAFAAPPAEDPVAWLWVRTATCVNPACGIETVLTTSWWLSKKQGQLAWIEPLVRDGRVHLQVVSNQRSGSPSAPPKVGRGATFSCIACSAILNEDEIIKQGREGKLGTRMAAVIAETQGQRIYREPTDGEHAVASKVPAVDDFPDLSLPDIPRWFSGPRFGFTTQRDQYTPRQLHVLATFADLVSRMHSRVLQDGGTSEWADAVTTLLGLAVGKLAQYGSTQTFLFTRNGPSAAKAAFGRADMPMMWDFVETYALGDSIGSWDAIVKNLIRSLSFVVAGTGQVVRSDARISRLPTPGLVATDPPYFDAIGYADMSDFFYVWHRRALRETHPDLYQTMGAPKSGELTAIPLHHGNSMDEAREYFIGGFTSTFQNLRHSMAPGLPMLVVYASKEQKSGAGEEARWSSILTAMLAADLEITGTWPVHGTTVNRMISAGTNAVASYIVMVCRPRSQDAEAISVTDFNRALRRELGPAIRNLQASSILPVDLSQAAMGPGMQIFSRYRAVLDQTGAPLGVDHALRLINAALAEVLDEQEGELDTQPRASLCAGGQPTVGIRRLSDEADKVGKTARTSAWTM